MPLATAGAGIQYARLLNVFGISQHVVVFGLSRLRAPIGEIDRWFGGELLEARAGRVVPGSLVVCHGRWSGWRCIANVFAERSCRDRGRGRGPVSDLAEAGLKTFTAAHSLFGRTMCGLDRMVLAENAAESSAGSVRNHDSNGSRACPFAEQADRNRGNR